MGMTGTRKGLTATLCAALVLALGACGDDDEPAGSGGGGGGGSFTAAQVKEASKPWD